MTEYPARLPAATSPVEAAVLTALDSSRLQSPGRRVRRHPALRIVHEDPLIERCYTKPRGYSGDAVETRLRTPAVKECGATSGII